jgi:hypothetical protein
MLRNAKCQYYTYKQISHTNTQIHKEIPTEAFPVNKEIPK